MNAKKIKRFFWVAATLLLTAPLSGCLFFGATVHENQHCPRCGFSGDCDGNQEKSCQCEMLWRGVAPTECAVAEYEPGTEYVTDSDIAANAGWESAEADDEYANELPTRERPTAQERREEYARYTTLGEMEFKPESSFASNGIRQVATSTSDDFAPRPPAKLATYDLAAANNKRSRRETCLAEMTSFTSIPPQQASDKATDPDIMPRRVKEAPPLPDHYADAPAVTVNRTWGSQPETCAGEMTASTEVIPGAAELAKHSPETDETDPALVPTVAESQEAPAETHLPPATFSNRRIVSEVIEPPGGRKSCPGNCKHSCQGKNCSSRTSTCKHHRPDCKYHPANRARTRAPATSRTPTRATSSRTPTRAASSRTPTRAATSPRTPTPAKSSGVRTASTTPQDWKGASKGGSGVVLATAEMPVEPASTQGSEKYFRNKNYTHLRGELQYSHTSREWKLRYLHHASEATDLFGGSVVLSGKMPQQFRPGQFVEVKGRVLTDVSNAGFAPLYKVDGIRRLQ